MTRLLDILALPFVFLAAIVMKFYRRRGSARMKLNTGMLKRMGVFPIRNHYYEPLFDHRQLRTPLSDSRNLPGLNMDVQVQKQFLENLRFDTDFQDFLKAQSNLSADMHFTLDNGSFAYGDAEFLYSFIRHLKPARVLEIGCGLSTKLISGALQLNQEEGADPARHVCVEPYEQAWLEKFPNIEVLRSPIEEMDLGLAAALEPGDFLFIDSSHMIRPQGDVLHEYLTIIPGLQAGVYVHVHDIFTPRDYPAIWVRDNVSFWNEQYILEAMLGNSSGYQIVAALNYLFHDHFDALQQACPVLTAETEPGSFYFRTT
ncbi:MAG: hypothetical protein CMQ38_04665 [Gammaproteobacteria bacterium]|nr:hypothetical protein [Gammaproteobacteria bacterium]|tara:strand:+ start:240 stop:1184 length:945 start_codon:yes stop_codon:yes gene_type:complete